MSEITDRELFFVPLDPTEVGPRSACREGFVLDPAKGFASKTGIGGDARSTVEMHAETRQRVQAYGAPVSMLNADSQQLALPGPPAQVWGKRGNGKGKGSRKGWNQGSSPSGFVTFLTLLETGQKAWNSTFRIFLSPSILLSAVRLWTYGQRAAFATRRDWKDVLHRGSPHPHGVT